jgi:hypothetical protein
MCGAVSFTATDVPDTFGVCHCEMCRRWTGSALMGVTVPLDGITWKGEAHIRTLQSSDWAERAWCQRCGTALYYHLTVDGPMSGQVELPLGLFDDPNGFTLTSEIFIDQKPDSYRLEGDHDRRTRAEVMAKFGVDL